MFSAFSGSNLKIIIKNNCLQITATHSLTLKLSLLKIKISLLSHELFLMQITDIYNTFASLIPAIHNPYITILYVNLSTPVKPFIIFPKHFHTSFAKLHSPKNMFCSLNSHVPSLGHTSLPAYPPFSLKFYRHCRHLCTAIHATFHTHSSILSQSSLHKKLLFHPSAFFNAKSPLHFYFHTTFLLAPPPNKTAWYPSQSLCNNRLYHHSANVSLPSPS